MSVWTAQKIKPLFKVMGSRLKQLISPARWMGILQHYQRRVPVRLQLSAVECGAASLAMILSYYGRQTRVAECRELIGIGRDGVTAEMLALAARTYGLRVKAYSIENLADFKYMQLPAIVHWNFQHFVVVERWSPKQVEIVDPGIGRRRLTIAQFDVGFTGVVLTFEPGVQFGHRRTKAQLSWRNYLIEHVIRAPGLLSQLLGTSLLLQILGLVLPILTKVLVDRVLPLHIVTVMPILGIGMLILFLAQAVTSQTLSMILDGAFVLGYLVLLLVQEPFFGIVVLIVGMLQVLLLLGTTPQVHDLMQQDLFAQAESQSYLVEALTGIMTLKASGGEDRAFDHWSNLFFKQLNVSLQRNHLAAVVDTAMLSLRTFSPLLLLWIGALRVLDGTMSLGTMLALNAIATSFLLPLTTLVSNGQRLQLVGAHLERLTDVLTAQSEQELQGVQPAPLLTGRIEFNQVSFRYDPNAPSVLHKISLTIEPGQKIALVGRSGSGKSTLAKLLLGLYLPTAGEILYDGIPLQALNWRTLRSQFGVVLQEPFLFSGSIRQNIAANNPSLAFGQVKAAAQLAAIHEEIMQFPMMYETRIAEGGNGLSGGQRQRLAIARALAPKPAILLLDEATSHLDGLTESLQVKSVARKLSTRACPVKANFPPKHKLPRHKASCIPVLKDAIELGVKLGIWLY